MNKQAWFDKASTRLERVSELTGLSPSLLTALLILIAGFVLALLLQGVARRLSSRAARLIAGLNHAGRDIPDTRQIDKGVGRAVFWLVMVCAGMAATETLGLPVVTTWLSGVATFVPRVVVAIFIVALGIVAARVARQVVSRMAVSAKLTGADRVGRIAELVLLVSTALIAIEQLGVEVSFLKTVLLILLAALVGGAALAFGMGGRELVANILAAHYVHKLYQVGQTVRIDDAEGRIVRFTETSVILESGEGQIAVPARRFSDLRSTLVTSVPGDAMSTEESLARAYAGEHPEEVARLFERMPPAEGAHLLAVLEQTSAAAVLAGADPSATARALQELSAERAGAVLEVLDPRAAVNALRHVEDERRTRLLASLAPGRSAQLAVLARYAPDTAGGRLDPRAPAFFEALSASEVLERLVAHPYGTLHYLYAVDEERRLTGVLNLRQLTLADRAAPLSAFMGREPSVLKAGDSLAVIVRHPGWMKHHALPVVEPGGRYLGAIRYGIFRAIEAELGRALSGPDPNDAAGALAELCAIGASAMARVAAAALSADLGSSDRRGR